MQIAMARLFPRNHGAHRVPYFGGIRVSAMFPAANGADAVSSNSTAAPEADESETGRQSEFGCLRVSYRGPPGSWHRAQQHRDIGAASMAGQ